MQEALKACETLEPYKRVLITTYTNECEQEIKDRITKGRDGMPQNLIIQTWFSFLLQHGVRPYQSVLFPELHEKRITLFPKEGQSAPGTGESSLNHYFANAKGFTKTKDCRIYKDKVSQFVCKTIEKEKKEDQKSYVLDRIKGIFPKIYIDEAQDFAGYDLDFFEYLIKEGIDITFVSDLRQRTYLTHYSQKGKQKKGEQKGHREDISDLFNRLKMRIDEETLNASFRNCQEICDFANRIHGDKYKACNSRATENPEFDQKEYDKHHGIWIVHTLNVGKYIKTYSPTLLRHSSKTDICGISSCNVFNFGKSKGLTFNRVLIFPTNPISTWLKNPHPPSNNENKSKNKSDKSACSFYVAVTRARYSVAFVCDENTFKKL